ncbi:MAG: hypothetical protein ACLGHY_02045 [Gammaproteobacteria bacterium]
MPSSRSPDPLRRRLLMAGVVLPAACAVPVPQLPPPAVPPPQPRVRVGDRWRYETINLYRGVPVGALQAQVVSAQDEGAGPLVVALADEHGAPTGEERWARAWNIIVDPSYDVVQTFQTPIPYLPDELVPGAQRSDATS